MAWKNLKAAVFKWHYILNKLLTLCSLIVCFIVWLSLKITLFDDTVPYADQISFVLLLVLFVVLVAALEGSWHYGLIQNAVEKVKPQWQVDGWDLELITNGRLLFRTGYISIVPKMYQPPSGESTTSNEPGILV
jgi:hypothetical protein